MIIHGVDSNRIVHPIAVDLNGVLLTVDSINLLSDTGPFVEKILDINLAAGTNVETMVTVPAGSIYKIQGVSLRYSGTVAGVVLRLAINRLAVNYPVMDLRGLTNNNVYYFTLPMTLDEGADLECSVFNATATNDFEGVVWGEQYQ